MLEQAKKINIKNVQLHNDTVKSLYDSQNPHQIKNTNYKTSSDIFYQNFIYLLYSVWYKILS